MVAPRALTPREEKQVAASYEKGQSSQALADKYGVHRSTIVTAVRRNGGELRRPGGSKPRKAPAKAVKSAKKK